MKRRVLLTASLVAGLALSAPIATAAAAERIVAIPQSTYATESVAIDQGEPLTFLNLDVQNHDVTARGKGADGNPLFSTPLIGAGQEVPVSGTDTLGPGSYAFYCTIHANMEGTLTVGGGGGGDDGKGPKLELDVLDKKLNEVRKAGELRVEMTVDEPASMKLTAAATVNGESTTLGKAKHDFPESGSHLMEIKLRKAGKSALRGAKKAKVDVSAKAEDAAGNKSTAKTRATLR